jgi:NADH-quinone oxidoreductase subunit C
MEPGGLVELLRPRFPDVALARDDVAVTVGAGELLETLRYLRNDPDLRFDFLSDVSAVDYPDREPRFWLAYQLYSFEYRHRLRVKVGIAGEDARIATVVPMYPTADWLEREVWDFFGIVFDGHPDLRRILMPDDWEGFPLRKDYGLGGVPTRYKGGAFIPPVDTRVV